MKHVVATLLLWMHVGSGSALAQSPLPPEAVHLAVQSGIEFLASDQNPDGSWGGLANRTFTSSFANIQTYRMWQIGATGLATRTMLENGTSAKHDAAADKALD